MYRLIARASADDRPVILLAGDAGSFQLRARVRKSQAKKALKQESVHVEPLALAREPPAEEPPPTTVTTAALDKDSPSPGSDSSPDVSAPEVSFSGTPRPTCPACGSSSTRASRVRESDDTAGAYFRCTACRTRFNDRSEVLRSATDQAALRAEIRHRRQRNQIVRALPYIAIALLGLFVLWYMKLQSDRELEPQDRTTPIIEGSDGRVSDPHIGTCRLGLSGHARSIPVGRDHQFVV